MQVFVAGAAGTITSLINDQAKQELHWRPATPSYRLGLDRLAHDAIQQGGSVKRPDAVR
jgi:hypothetical protein